MIDGPGITSEQVRRIGELWPWQTVTQTCQAGVIKSVTVSITLKPGDIDLFIDNYMGKISVVR